MVKQLDPDSLFDETFLGFYVEYRNTETSVGFSS